jgi:hypothetical protein
MNIRTDRLRDGFKHRDIGKRPEREERVWNRDRLRSLCLLVRLRRRERAGVERP